jgi:hypothetical protein
VRSLVERVQQKLAKKVSKCFTTKFLLVQIHGYEKDGDFFCEKKSNHYLSPSSPLIADVLKEQSFVISWSHNSLSTIEI